MKLLLAWIFLLAASLNGHAQAYKGIVRDKLTKEGIPGVQIKIGLEKTEYLTDNLGQFNLNMNRFSGKEFLHFVKDGYQSLDYGVDVSTWPSEGIEINLERIVIQPDQISSVVIEDTEDDASESAEVYSLLGSSEDAVGRAISFQFSPFRYRYRGLDYAWNELGANGFLFNGLDYAHTQFYLFSGQNELTRYSDDYYGYTTMSPSFGSAGVNQWINIRPDQYRKELKLLAGVSNRNVAQRLGLEFGRKLNPSVAILLGVNRRWTQESFIEGVFYDAWGVHGAISKKFKNKGEIIFTGVLAPVYRGKSSPATKEMYELANNNLYNSYWGYQSGEKRNSRAAYQSIPVAMLQYSMPVSDHFKFETGVMGLKGKRKKTQLDWTDATDPRPDYYQKLPSYIKDPVAADVVRKLLTENESARQLNWHSFYNANRSNIVTIQDVNGIPGSNTTGKSAIYILSDYYNDPAEFEHYSQFQWVLKKWLVDAGYRLEFQQVNYYAKLRDLLGADFYLDREDFISDPTKQNPNISKVNYLSKEGDLVAYNYSGNTNKYTIYNQWVLRLKHWDLMFGGQLDHTGHQREGKWQNALFENSKGKSEWTSNLGYGAKSQLTYKINGRNYVVGHFAYQSIAPTFEQSFSSPQYSGNLLVEAENKSIQDNSISYYHRAPKLKMQLRGYLINIKNQTKPKFFFLDEGLESAGLDELGDGGLINSFYTGLDQRHMGIEASAECKLGYSISLTAVICAGDYIYTSRPELLIFDKFSNVSTKHLIYLKEFRVSGTPQTALSGGLKYELKKGGFFTLTASYVDQNYVDINPLRRVPEAVEDLDRASGQFKSIIEQEKLPSAFSLDFFIYKSFNFWKRFSSISFAANNLLNNKNMISGGFEQSRFDYETKDPTVFPNKYFYLQGINYNLSLNISLWKQ